MPIPIKTGETLRGRYRIRRIIGQGGMGCIYLADDLRLEGRQCAVKEVEHDRTLPSKMVQEARQQFMREATVLARLDHPNMPKVSDFFTNGPRDYLVMDYVPGKDLRYLMTAAQEKKGYLHEEDVLDWANQLADVLTYLHQQTPPILHRDIKPSNLKLTPSKVLKLVDFGLVKLLAPGEVTITILQGQGTALYTPFEQYGGDIGHTDARSDIYAFGATLYHLLTNHPPADARERFLNPTALVEPKSINPMINIRTQRAILWALELHPDDRPENVEIFRDALIGSRPIMTSTGRRIQPKYLPFQSKIEKGLLIAASIMAVLTLLITLLR
jgi:eukaryotic-like serine/threonine-protein kinase